MRLKDYIRDRLPALVICVAAIALAVLFMTAYRLPGEGIGIIGGILALGALSAGLWDFLRRKRWYGKLLRCAEELDKKYLLAETVGKPELLDGRILYEVLRQGNASMCEQVANYRRESRDFREYIELWVHEIKLPVAGLQLMCHNNGDQRYSEQLRRIDGCIENVLYYARSGSAEKDYIIKPVSLKRTFADAALRSREELQERGISLRTEGLDTEVVTDGKWLTFIFGQLMANSMKYGAEEIFVSAQVLPDRTELRFRDDGCGIAESELPYIFERSFTGSNGRTQAKSTGMGLYIVRKLCRKLGHGISASSEQGKFTEICMTFGRNDLHDVRQQPRLQDRKDP
ncbi:MAG: sensor histidine kinase [Ruminococcus sp.]|nr:sensor histidine kinase [Ruminococcus sp.]